MPQSWTGLAHTFRCAFSTRFASFADLKVCASRIFHSFLGSGPHGVKCEARV
jgi:hypothetical protein